MRQPMTSRPQTPTGCHHRHDHTPCGTASTPAGFSPPTSVTDFADPLVRVGLSMRLDSSISTRGVSRPRVTTWSPIGIDTASPRDHRRGDQSPLHHRWSSARIRRSGSTARRTPQYSDYDAVGRHQRRIATTTDTAGGRFESDSRRGSNGVGSTPPTVVATDTPRGQLAVAPLGGLPPPRRLPLGGSHRQYPHRESLSNLVYGMASTSHPPPGGTRSVSTR